LQFVVRSYKLQYLFGPNYSGSTIPAVVGCIPCVCRIMAVRTSRANFLVRDEALGSCGRYHEGATATVECAATRRVSHAAISWVIRGVIPTAVKAAVNKDRYDDPGASVIQSSRASSFRVTELRPATG